MRSTRAALWIAALCVAHAAHAWTKDELIAKHIEARGGLDKMQAIRTLRFEGTRTRSGGGFEMAFVEIRKRPGSLRSETTNQGRTWMRATDGKEGWSVQPFRGRKDPERLPADALEELSYDADLDGPLVDADTKGNRIAYLGLEDVDGTEAHKLEVTRASGDVDFVYLDPDYFPRDPRSRPARSRVETETDYGSYERVAGVYFPFSIESGGKGSREKGQKVTITKAEANVSVDDAIFGFPGGKPAQGK
jgi:hypothetical protein